MGTNRHRDLDETSPNRALGAPGRPQAQFVPAYTFLGVTLDMRRQLLIRGNEQIRLRPRAFDVLSHLVMNAGRLVSKQELMDAVWADVVVTDDALVQCLMEIRRGLGSDEGIKTVRGRGYLLDCEVHHIPAVDSSGMESAPQSLEGVDGRLDARVNSGAKFSPPRWIRARPFLTLVIGSISTVSVATILAYAVFHSTAATGSATNVVRFTISPPSGTVFGSGFGSGSVAANVETTSLALSPDGSQLAFIATDPSNRRNVWLRPLQSLDARLVPATQGATSAFWSPDSRSIAFFAKGKLNRLDLSGGAAVTLCDVTEGTGLSGTWGRDDILFAAPEGHEIFRISASGGSPRREVAPDPAAREISVGWPWFLPDGRRFLYVARVPDRQGHLKLAEPGKPAAAILAAISNVQWVDPDYFVFAREGTLVAQRVDLAAGRAVGDVLSLASPVQYTRSTARTNFSVSRTGTLVYQARGDLFQLVWFDRSGREIGRVGPQGDYLRVRISPDGRRVVFHRTDPRLGTSDLWLEDLARGVETRLTSDPSSEIAGVWLPNGRGVVFAAEREGPPHLFLKDLETGSDKELLRSKQRLQIPTDVSPDGRIVAFEQISERGDADLWTVRIDGEQQPSPLIGSTFNERSLHFSPDGRLVAFSSDESGATEIYVALSTVITSKKRVSDGGAWSARWSPDGRELFYLSADGYVMAASIHEAPSLEIGVPERLFSMQGRWPWRDFDVSPEGKRFLAIVPQIIGNGQSLTAVLNWPAQVRR